MKYKYPFFVLLCISIFSCQNNKIDYFANGNKSKEYQLHNGKLDGTYKEFFENGKTKVIHVFENGIKIDSSIFYKKDENYIERIDYYSRKDSVHSKFYFENGQIEEEGYFLNKQKTGKWKYYNKAGKVEKVFEYCKIRGDQYTNQGWYFDKKGDTILQLGNYFKISPLPKSIQIKDMLDIIIKYKPLMSLKSNAIVCFGSKINDDFSNLSSIHLDTIPLVSNEANIKVSFKNKGKKNIRGFIAEFLTSADKTTKSKNTYFDIPIVVK